MADTSEPKGENVAVVKRSANSAMSKTRFAQIMSMAEEYIQPDKKDEFAARFCEIMRYDNTLSVHTPARYASKMASIRRKAAETNTSTYVTNGRKKAYERAKQACAT